MANKHRGHVDLVADDKLFKLVFSTNAICELEDETGESISEIGKKLEKDGETSMKFVRQIVWAALRDFHGEMSLLDAGTLIHKAGLKETMEAVGEAFQLAFPAPPKSDQADGDLGNAPSPRKASRVGRG